MRFSIRDLLWAMALAAICFGWYAHSENQRHAVADLEHKYLAQKERHDWFWGDGKFRDMPSDEHMMYQFEYEKDGSKRKANPPTAEPHKQWSAEEIAKFNQPPTYPQHQTWQQYHDWQFTGGGAP